MIQDCGDSSKKRKRDGSLQQEDFLYHPASTNTNHTKRLVLDTELHLDTPMPFEWQRCLDIKSGQIHYYNTRTHKKTSMDPRSSPDAELPKNMSLDLELNLPCGSSDTTKKHHVADNFSKYKTSSETTNRNGGVPSWLALEGGDQQQEMMTAVCKKCHMLVMMIKISPSCPNCKFMHPPNQTPPSLFNRELSLLC
ncbi:putative WW domain superfamily protein [Helianthus anomalus]